MASVFGIYKIVDKKVFLDHVEWIGFEEGTGDNTPKELGIKSPLTQVNKSLPFRVYWEYFCRDNKMYLTELRDE